MGVVFIDRFSLLHFSVGALFYTINIDFIYTILAHTVFEIIENAPFGVNFINTHLSFWPGKKRLADTFKNSTSDLLFSIIGWLSAKKIRDIYKIKNIYILLLSLTTIIAFLEVRKTISLI